MKIGVQVLSDLTKKKMFGMNYLDTRPPITFGDYIQVKRETIISPSYRIFIADEGYDRFDDLKHNLLTGQWVYSPYLGVAEFGAHIDDVVVHQGQSKT
jgi:CRISPR-associated protein Cas5 subtype I-B